MGYIQNFLGMAYDQTLSLGESGSVAPYRGSMIYNLLVDEEALLLVVTLQLFSMTFKGGKGDSGGLNLILGEYHGALPSNFC